MHQVEWTDYVIKTFLFESGLIFRSEHESQEARNLITTFKMHVSDATNSEIAEVLGYDSKRIDDFIRDLKNIYDDIVYYTHKLRPRINLTQTDKRIQMERYGKVLDNIR